MEPKNIESSINFDSLLKLGYAVVDARYCEYEVTKEQYKFVIARVTTDRDTFYRDMIKTYYPQFNQERDIYEMWINILQHKIAMSRILKRDVSIKVAVFDYLETANSSN